MDMTQAETMLCCLQSGWMDGYHGHIGGDHEAGSGTGPCLGGEPQRAGVGGQHM